MHHLGAWSADECVLVLDSADDIITLYGVMRLGIAWEPKSLDMLLIMGKAILIN